MIKELRQKLLDNNCIKGDYAVVIERFGNQKAWVYACYEQALKHYNRIKNSLISDSVFYIEQV